MKIIDAKTFVVGNPWKNWVFVKLYTDEGITGVGEATGGLQTKPNEASVHELKPLYIGKDPRNVHEIMDSMRKGLFLGYSTAMSGIEQACWDILGKSLGVPVWRLLGGKMRPRIRAYANGWYRGPRDPAFFAEAALRTVEMGYTALKFDPFGNAYRFMERDEERLSLNIVRAVREAVGESVDLLIEAHDRFSVSTAVKLGHALAEFNPMWFETPVMSTDVEATIAVASQVPIPVASGERFDSLAQFSRLLGSKVVSIAQPEVLKIGGISGMVKAAAIAESHESFIAPHNAQSPLCTVINTHVGAAVPNLLIQECFDDTNAEWSRRIMTGTVQVKDGYIEIPDDPGLGVDLNEEEMSKYPYGDQNFLRLFEAGWEKRREIKG
ncbi:mandelate racemase/muconate lactonizing enzyme family protein [Paenibacillus cremeus]|uniref:Mandelate racemase/muconate lactonizing enzyme family protein n=1 Tax=Paenibacillus cremeus TaxID=2163881 RepID=A0A559K5T1_9BACL|nr:mandelate racemase/muconate lactonizing enzyme family protein [Paenibacillus cremeus]TVY07508.1 mandelate racemase/muconate lactonizing enzyme family protein [Paenibacillus cremeus]